MLQASAVLFVGNGSCCSLISSGTQCVKMAAEQQCSIWAVYFWVYWRPDYLWSPGLWWQQHMSFLLPQREVVCIHAICCGMFCLVCMVVLSGWQRAWETLCNFFLFLFLIGEERLREGSCCSLPAYSEFVHWASRPPLLVCSVIVGDRTEEVSLRALSLFPLSPRVLALVRGTAVTIQQVEGLLAPLAKVPMGWIWGYFYSCWSQPEPVLLPALLSHPVCPTVLRFATGQRSGAAYLQSTRAKRGDGE